MPDTAGGLSSEFLVMSFHRFKRSPLSPLWRPALRTVIPLFDTALSMPLLSTYGNDLDASVDAERSLHTDGRCLEKQ